MMTFWYNISGPSQWPKHCTCIIMSEHNKQLHNIQPGLNQSLLKTILCNIIIIIKIITIYYKTSHCKAWEGGTVHVWARVGISVSDPKFLSNACGSGVVKLSNKVEGPHPRNTKYLVF